MNKNNLSQQNTSLMSRSSLLIQGVKVLTFGCFAYLASTTQLWVHSTFTAKWGDPFSQGLGILFGYLFLALLIFAIIDLGLQGKLSFFLWEYYHNKNDRLTIDKILEENKDDDLNKVLIANNQKVLIFLKTILTLFVVRGLLSAFLTFIVAGEMVEAITTPSDHNTYLEKASNLTESNDAKIAELKKERDQLIATEKSRIADAAKTGDLELAAFLKTGNKSQQKEYHLNGVNWMKLKRAGKSNNRFARKIQEKIDMKAELIQFEKDYTKTARDDYDFALNPDSSLKDERAQYLALSKNEQHQYAAKKMKRTSYAYLLDVFAFIFGIIGCWIIVQRRIACNWQPSDKSLTYVLLRAGELKYLKWISALEDKWIIQMEKILQTDLDGNGEIGTVGEPSPPHLELVKHDDSITLRDVKGVAASVAKDVIDHAIEEMKTSIKAVTPPRVIVPLEESITTPPSKPVTLEKPVITPTITKERIVRRYRLEDRKPIKHKEPLSIVPVTPPNELKKEEGRVVEFKIEGLPKITHNKKDYGESSVRTFISSYFNKLLDAKGKLETNQEGLTTWMNYLGQITIQKPNPAGAWEKAFDKFLMKKIKKLHDFRLQHFEDAFEVDRVSKLGIFIENLIDEIEKKYIKPKEN